MGHEMAVPDKYEGVLFSQTARSGADRFGYYQQDDPNWFIWREPATNPIKETVHRALVSPLVRTWHVVAKSKGAGKWRYRGAHQRVQAFSPRQGTTGLLLERHPDRDVLDLHASLQEPLPVLEVAAPESINAPPLLRAKLTFAQLMHGAHGGGDTITSPPDLACVNVYVFDRVAARFEPPAFFMSLLFDEVYACIPDTRMPSLVRNPVPVVPEAEMRAQLADKPHPVDPLLLCHSDEDDVP
ncbi:hypothetical protein WJX74_009694 [Apatococcus lobatus]|uniref:Uncharacterized protein n=2 Tax=Apatococcus TaxID=904362 RepID=A0AAW1T4B7_9CHLO